MGQQNIWLVSGPVRTAQNDLLTLHQHAIAETSAEVIEATERVGRLERWMFYKGLAAQNLGPIKDSDGPPLSPGSLEVSGNQYAMQIHDIPSAIITKEDRIRYLAEAQTELGVREGVYPYSNEDTELGYQGRKWRLQYIDTVIMLPLVEKLWTIESMQTDNLGTWTVKATRREQARKFTVHIGLDVGADKRNINGYAGAWYQARAERVIRRDLSECAYFNNDPTEWLDGRER